MNKVKKILGRFVQIILDILVGVAAYYFMTTFTSWNANVILLLTLLCTAIFAELFEVRSKE